MVTWYGIDLQTIGVERFDLEDQNHLRGLILAAGTGRFQEACVEFDCTDAYELFRGLITSTGGTEKIECRESDKVRRLYRPGYEIYAAADEVIYFLNPVPRPELFSVVDNAAYVQEFEKEERA
jgi:hypothetical protein